MWTTGVDRAARPPRVPDEQILAWVCEYARRRDRAEESVSGEPGRRRGDLPLADLKARIARHHASLVESVARRFASSGEPVEDLIQEGSLGLLSALESFEPGKGVKFSTYATHFIAGTIRHFLRDKGKVIKEPAWLRETAHRVERTSEALTLQLGRPPHPAEVAQVLELSEGLVEEVLSTRQVFQVLALGEGDESGLAGFVDPEKIRPPRATSPEVRIEDRMVLTEAMERLKTLEREVLHAFFYEDLSQAEIARRLRVSGNYVSFLLKNSTQKLRRVLGEAEVRHRSRYREESVLDPLTALHTAAYMRARLEEQISRAVRASQPVAMLLVRWEEPPRNGGHLPAETLALCGAVARRSIRRMDLVGHGDAPASLMVILPDTGPQATVVAERLRVALPREVAAVRRLHIRLAWHPEHGRSAQALLQKAEAEERLPDAA